MRTHSYRKSIFYMFCVLIVTEHVLYVPCSNQCVLIIIRTHGYRTNIFYIERTHRR